MIMLSFAVGFIAGGVITMFAVFALALVMGGGMLEKELREAQNGDYHRF